MNHFKKINLMLFFLLLMNCTETSKKESYISRNKDNRKVIGEKKRDIPTGIWKIYNDDGIVITKLIYTDTSDIDKIDIKKRDYIVHHFSEDGQKLFTHIFQNGEIISIQTDYDSLYSEKKIRDRFSKYKNEYKDEENLFK